MERATIRDLAADLPESLPPRLALASAADVSGTSSREEKTRAAARKMSREASLPGSGKSSLTNADES
jgi:hypothetical protein